MKIQPKCEKGKQSKDYAYSAKGFLLPCCWCDVINPNSDKELLKLFNPQLHLSNVDFFFSHPTFHDFIWKALLADFCNLLFGGIDSLHRSTNGLAASSYCVTVTFT